MGVRSQGEGRRRFIRTDFLVRTGKGSDVEASLGGRLVAGAVLVMTRATAVCGEVPEAGGGSRLPASLKMPELQLRRPARSVRRQRGCFAKEDDSAAAPPPR